MKKKKKNKAKKSGRSRGRKWTFFDKMDSIMGHRANISPPLVLESSAEQNEESVMSESEDEKVSNGNSYFTFLFIYFYLFVELDGMIDWFMFCGMKWPQNIKRTSSKLRF